MELCISWSSLLNRNAASYRTPMAVSGLDHVLNCEMGLGCWIKIKIPPPLPNCKCWFVSPALCSSFGKVSSFFRAHNCGASCVVWCAKYDNISFGSHNNLDTSAEGALTGIKYSWLLDNSINLKLVQDDWIMSYWGDSRKDWLWISTAVSISQWLLWSKICQILHLYQRDGEFLLG